MTDYTNDLLKLFNGMEGIIDILIPLPDHSVIPKFIAKTLNSKSLTVEFVENFFKIRWCYKHIPVVGVMWKKIEYIFSCYNSTKKRGTRFAEGCNEKASTRLKGLKRGM